MEITQSIQLTPPVKFSRHGKHKNQNYHREYYQKNRKKLLTYSHDYYGVKKSLANFSKKDKKITSKNGVKKNFLTGTRNITYSNINKEAFFFAKGINRKRTRREILEECLDKELTRLATKLTKDSKCQPIKKGWTCSNFKEWLSKEQLLELYKQWSVRCGVRIGRKFLSFLDIDIEQEKFQSWVKKRLRANVILLLKRFRICYIETKRGFHIPLLSDELLTNEIVYHVDSWEKVKRIIGSIQSKGKFVIGFDSPDKVLVANQGKCFWQVKNQAELKEILAKFFLIVGNLGKTKKETITNQVSVNVYPYLKKEPKQSLSAGKFTIQAQVLGRKKTCLADIWKVFYLNQQGKKGYFLLNDYQKPKILEQLPRGIIFNLGLIQGSKHSFFNRME